MKDILVTAFEPFNNQSENSSLEVIKRIKNINSKILPVRYDPLIYKELLEKKSLMFYYCVAKQAKDVK